MLWAAVAAAALAAAGLIGAGIRGSAASSDRAAGADGLKGFSRDGLDSLMTRLKTESAPDPVLGAMCYDMALPAPVTEYVCPVCGERTVYEQWCWLLHELPRSRELFQAIADSVDFPVMLDERLLCSHCAPSDEEPGIVLVAVPAEGDTVRNPVSQGDLLMLLRFLQGDLTFDDDFGGINPLQPHAARIALLLGLERPE